MILPPHWPVMSLAGATRPLTASGAATIALEHHRRLLAVKVLERLQIAISFPTGRAVFDELAPKLQHFDHLLVGEEWLVVLVEQSAAIRLDQLTHQDVDEEIVARQRDPVDVDLA